MFSLAHRNKLCSIHGAHLGRPTQRSTSYKLLARVIKLTKQLNYEEVKKTDGKWSPKAVLCIMSLADMLSVSDETKLESSNNIW